MHVDRAGASAKVWLETVALAGNAGFRTAELSELLRLVRANCEIFLEAWHGFFDPG